MDPSGWKMRIVYLHNVHTRAWVRPLAGDKLNKEHTAGEDVQFAGVYRGLCQCLGRHVGIGFRTIGGSEVAQHAAWPCQSQPPWLGY